MTTNPDKVKLQFENPRCGTIVTITLAELLDVGTPINEDGVDMEFVSATIG